MCTFYNFFQILLIEEKTSWKAYKSQNEGRMNDEGWMKDDEGWWRMMKDEWRMNEGWMKDEWRMNEGWRINDNV